MKNKSREEEYIDLGQVLQILWKHAVPILAAGLALAVLLFLYAWLFVPASYEASVLLYVNNSTMAQNSTVRISTGELNAASDLVDTYVAILNSRSNLEQVLEESGANYSYEQLHGMVTAKAVNSTGLFRVSVRSHDREEAYLLANTIAKTLPEKISDIVANSSVEVVDYAVMPQRRVSPSYKKYAAVGLLGGMLLSGAAVLLMSWLDDVIRDEDWLQENYEAPVLATVPDLTAKTPKKYGSYGGASGAGSRKGGVE